MKPGSSSGPRRFAADQDDAEKGRPGSAPSSQPNAVDKGNKLPRSNTGKEESLADVSGNVHGNDVDGPFSQFCTALAVIWKLYMDEAKKMDDTLANEFNSDLDPLLIFAGLFSAILSAFLIEIRKNLQQDPQDTTNTLLMTILQSLHNATETQILPSSRFEPTSASRWVNGLWFASLMFSLMSALGASLAKGWVTQFSSIGTGSSWGDASTHCSRFRGLCRWHLKLIVQWLPILIHIAFFLFSVGLVILVFQDDLAIGIMILALTVLVMALYIASTIHPAFSPDSPFRTPGTGTIRRLLSGTWRLEDFSPFPSEPGAQKAQALLWLLNISPNVNTTHEAVRAIAGLPANIYVQEELLCRQHIRGQTIGPLLRILSEEITKNPLDTEALSYSLYAVLHVLQGTPASPATSSALKALVTPGGALVNTDSLPPGIRELALCVKCRVLLLCHGVALEAILLETDIPLLIRACPEPHLRRLLIEIQLLAYCADVGSIRSASKKHSCNFLAILRDSNSPHRHRAHAELVSAAISERDRTDSIAKFGMKTLLDGLSSGSTEFRRRYARIFVELAADASFRVEMVTSGTETDFCSLLQYKDEEIGKLVVDAFRLLAAHDNSRMVVTRGIPGIIEGLAEENAPAFWRMAGLLVDVAAYDDIREMINKTGLVNRVLIKSLQHNMKIGMPTVLKLIESDDTHGEIFATDTVQKVLSMLADSDQYVRNSACRIVTALAQYHNVRTANFTRETIQNIVSMLAHSELYVRCVALDTLTALAQYTDVRAATFTVETMQKLVSMVGDSDSNVRDSARETFTALVQYKDVRTATFTAETMRKVVSMLADLNRDVRNSARETVTVLAQYNDVCTAAFTAETMRNVVSMLRDSDSDLRDSAYKTVTALAQYEDVRMATFTPETMQNVVLMLEDSELFVRRIALETLIALAQYRDVRMVTFTAETMQNVVSMLGDSLWYMRHLALKALTVLAQYEDVRRATFPSETMQKVMSMLGDSESDVEHYASETFTALAQFQDVRLANFTAETLQGVVSMLGDSAWYVRRLALKTLTAMAQYEDFRRAAFTTETMQKVVSILGDSDSNVRRSALETLAALAEYKDVHTATFTKQTIQKVVSMLANPHSHMRHSAQTIITTLAKYEDVRMATFTPDTMQSVLSMLGDLQLFVRRVAIETLTALAQYRDVRTTTFTAEIMQNVVLMLGDSAWYVRHLALKTLTALAQYEDVRRATFPSETMQKVMSMLGDLELFVRCVAFETLTALAQYGDVRTATFTAETFQNAVAMLGDSVWYVRHSALKTLTALAQYEDVHTATFTTEMMQEVVSMLVDPDPDVRHSAHETVIALAQYEGVRALSFTTEVVQKVVLMLGDPDPLVRCCACHTLTSLAQYEDIRVATFTTHTGQAVVSMLADSDLNVHRAAIAIVAALVQYDAFGASFFLPKFRVQLLELLNGCHRDTNVLASMLALILLDDQISVNCIDLFNATLERLRDAAPPLRKSCIEVIKMLPLSAISIPTGISHQLLVHLVDVDANVVDSAVLILLCAFTNAQFRQGMLTPDFWKITVQLLHQPSIAYKALQIIIDLAQYDDAREKVIQSTSGIVPTLLNMLHAGTTDIDRWQIGVKGLLALRLFETSLA